MNWQPIDTYQIPVFDPALWYKSGPSLLVFNGYFTVIAKYGYTKTGKGRFIDHFGRNCTPTHWMPMPEPPATDRESERAG